VLIVSNRAVITESGKQYLLIKQEEGEPLKTEVVTGFSDGVSVEVVSGVEEGDVALIESKVS
jgi:HlyD family secretion protein